MKLDTYSHAIPAMQEEAAALIAGLVFDAAWQLFATTTTSTSPGLPMLLPTPIKR